MGKKTVTSMSQAVEFGVDWRVSLQPQELPFKLGHGPASWAKQWPMAFLYLSWRKKSQVAQQRKCSSEGVYFQVRFKIWVFVPGSNHDPSHASCLAGSALRYRSSRCKADNSTLAMLSEKHWAANMGIRTSLQLHTGGACVISHVHLHAYHTYTQVSK